MTLEGGCMGGNGSKLKGQNRFKCMHGQFSRSKFLIIYTQKYLNIENRASQILTVLMQLPTPLLIHDTLAL